MPKTLNARDTALLCDIRDFLQHGGTHLRGLALDALLQAFLRRRGYQTPTVLSEDEYKTMQAQIEDAERREAEADAAQRAEAAERPLFTPEQVAAVTGLLQPPWERERRADGNRPPDDGTEDGWDTRPSTDSYVHTAITAMTEIADHGPDLGDVTRLAVTLEAVLQAIHDEHGEIAVRLDYLLRQQMANQL